MRRRRVLVLMGVAAATLAATATATAAASRHATLATFAGSWFGHTRSLVITRNGSAKESLGSGCCDPVVDLDLRLSRPRGTPRTATVLARVTAVHIHDKSLFTRADPAPRVGETRRLRLRLGVITEPITQTNYCNARADRTGVCGA